VENLIELAIKHRILQFKVIFFAVYSYTFFPFRLFTNIGEYSDEI